MFLVFLDYHLRYIYMPKLNTSVGKGKIKKRRVKKVGQNAEVMPRPLN